MAPSVLDNVNEVNADISNNPTKLSQPIHHDTPPATPPNYESTYQNRHKAEDVKVTKHIWIITGPAGCGKTTVAKAVSAKLNMHYLEGDDVGITPTLVLGFQHDLAWLLDFFLTELLL